MATDERDGRGVVIDEPLSALWARRDDLVDDLGDGGGGAAARRLADELDVARARETKAGVTRAAIEEQVEATGGWRRRERLGAERRLGAAAGAEARRRSEREQVEAALARARSDEVEWVAGHRRELEEISDLDDAITWRTELAGRAAEIDRPEHIVATLGEPPGDLVGRERWRAAAGVIESYRARWNTEPTDQVVSMSLEQTSHQVAARALIDAFALVGATIDPPHMIQIGEGFDRGHRPRTPRRRPYWRAMATPVRRSAVRSRPGGAHGCPVYPDAHLTGCARPPTQGEER